MDGRTLLLLLIARPGDPALLCVGSFEQAEIQVQSTFHLNIISNTLGRICISREPSDDHHRTICIYRWCMCRGLRIERRCNVTMRIWPTNSDFRCDNRGCSTDRTQPGRAKKWSGLVGSLGHTMASVVTRIAEKPARRFMDNMLSKFSRSHVFTYYLQRLAMPALPSLRCQVPHFALTSQPVERAPAIP